VTIPYPISNEAIEDLRWKIKQELETVIKTCKASLAELEKYGDCECSGLQNVWKIFKLEGKLDVASKARAKLDQKE
jgi:hypothetical protein